MFERAKVARNYGISNEDLGTFEPSIAFASTTNAMPTVFWMLSYIFADPKLAAEIRGELMHRVDVRVVVNGGKEVKEGYINMTNISTECPLLMSTYNETMRIANGQVSARLVKEDTTITMSSSGSYPSSYLLKKGSPVQIPSRVAHMAESTWGSDSHVFDAKRFMNARNESLDKDVSKARRQGFLPFGGGKHLCPGRHFALAEILGMAAAFVVGFEIVEQDENGQMKIYTIPKLAPRRFGQGVMKPDVDPRVLIRRREDLKDVIWKFRFDKGMTEETSEV